MQRTRKLLYKDYDERVHHMIDKKLECLSIHTNIAEFRYKAAEFSDTKEMHVQTKRER